MKAASKSVSTAKSLRHRLEWVALRTVAAIIPLFPRPFVWRLGRGLGALAYRLSANVRAVSRANLELAFGTAKTPAEKDRIARRSLQNAVATILCLFWSRRLTRENYRQFVEIDAANLEALRAIKQQNRPVIFLTLHFGDWELLGQTTGFMGFPLTVVQEAMRNSSLETIFARLRGVSGHALVPNRFAATTLLRTLKHGGSIALLIDQNATRKRGGTWLEFFGLPVFSPAAIGAFALRTQAALIPGVAYPLGNGRTRIEYGPEIVCPRTGDDAADVRALNQACLRFCESVIREQPEHWLWSYKRWTPRATPEQGRYPAYSRYVKLEARP
ncbi:MAG: Lipid A biosynthesis palmitoleoyltransferase [Verrucomicrobiae bacterium]|nr:Lipid A biosynthesis palmitoleoyltransferase [Verrucomicrobiae bacterium]